MAKRGTIILDPGHGGKATKDLSSPNNATSPSGVLEKNITLAVAFLTRDAITQVAAAEGHEVRVVLTRETDENLGLAARAALANQHDADLLLSIHCNASDSHTARGVETWIRPAIVNSNHADDRVFARTIQDATLLAIRKHDTDTPDRGVREKRLGVLNDEHLGPRTKACLVELEFIDRHDVDALLNTGPRAPLVRGDIATSLARALITNLPDIPTPADPPTEDVPG